MIIALFVIGGIIAALASYVAVLNLCRYTVEVLNQIRLLHLETEAKRQVLNMARVIPPNESGTFPLLESGGHVLDPGRGLLYDLVTGLVAANPDVARPEQMRRILQGAGGWPAGGATNALLPEPQAATLPREIPLKSVAMEPDIKSLVLGVTVNDSGEAEIVKADMGHLVHIAVGGSSGWGKSVFLRSLAYQLALSRTPTDLVMVDLEGATLAPFARCGRLLYPIADTEADALAVFNALLDELERRKGLYAVYPGADSLDAYNAQADEPLTPLVAIVDEATALLGDKSVESALRTLALRARKYGLWLLLAGQDWKASTLDTAIRNQLSSRIQFKAMSGSQSRVLLAQGGAEDLDTEGRAMAILPGRAMFTMQAPFISARTIMADVSDGGPREPMPAGNGHNSELTEKVKALYANGLGLGAIAEEIWGYRNSRKTSEIKDILGLD